MIARFVGHVVIYGVVVPYIYRNLALPMLIDWLVEYKAEHITTDLLESLKRRQEEMNTPGFRKRQ